MANRSRSFRERPRFNAKGRPARPKPPEPPPQPAARLEQLRETIKAMTAPRITPELIRPITRVREAIPTRSDLTWLRKLADIMGLGPIKRTLEGEEPFPWKKK